mgnify:CR=1 FL=1
MHVDAVKVWTLKMTEPDLNKQLNDLIEREREILKKMNVARRAGASDGVIGQMMYMLDEVKFEQQDIRAKQAAGSGKDNDFGSFISIG